MNFNSGIAGYLRENNLQVISEELGELLFTKYGTVAKLFQFPNPNQIGTIVYNTECSYCKNGKLFYNPVEIEKNRISSIFKLISFFKVPTNQEVIYFTANPTVPVDSIETIVQDEEQVLFVYWYDHHPW